MGIQAIIVLALVTALENKTSFTYQHQMFFLIYYGHIFIVQLTNVSLCTLLELWHNLLMDMGKHLDPAHKMRQTHDALKKREAAQHPVSGEALGLGGHDRSLADIFRDKHHQDIFVNVFLANRDYETTKGIIQARVDKTVLTDEQTEFLEKARVDYNLRSFEANSVTKMLTVGQVREIARSDERVALLVGQVGESNAPKFLGDQIEELAMTDTEGFQKIVESFKEVAKIEGSKEAKANEERLTARLKKYGIAEDKYTEATKSGETRESQKNLSGLVKEQLKGFWKGVNFATFGLVTYAGGRKLYNTFAERTRLLGECDEHLVAVAKILNGTINEDVRLEIENQAFEGSRGGEARTAPTISDYRKIRDESTPEARAERFKKRRDDLAHTIYRKKWNDIKQTERNFLKGSKIPALKRSFFDDEEKLLEKYKGQGLVYELMGIFIGDRNAMRTQIDNL